MTLKKVALTDRPEGRKPLAFCLPVFLSTCHQADM